MGDLTKCLKENKPSAELAKALNGAETAAEHEATLEQYIENKQAEVEDFRDQLVDQGYHVKRPAEEPTQEEIQQYPELFQDGAPTIEKAQRNSIGLYSGLERELLSMRLPNWKYHKKLDLTKEEEAELEALQAINRESFITERAGERPWTIREQNYPEFEKYRHLEGMKQEHGTLSEEAEAERVELLTTMEERLIADKESYQQKRSNAIREYEDKRRPLIAKKRKAQGLATGKEIWQKIKSLPIKKEEIKWVGIEEYLLASEEKFTREEVVNFVRNNGVVVEETLADDGRDGEEDSYLSFDGGEVYDDPEAWQDRASDLESEDYIVDPIVDEMTNEHDADIEEALGEGYDMNAAYGWLRDNTDIDEKIEQAAEEAAREEYMENPYMLYHAETDNGNTDLYIFGNDDVGYSIREDGYAWQDRVEDSNIDYEIWSVSEAEIQAEAYAREQGYLVDEDSEDIAKWENWVMPGRYKNYRELKLKLPGITNESGEPFIYDAHFGQEEDIVAFLRVEDREFTDPDKLKKNMEEMKDAKPPADFQVKTVGTQYGWATTESIRETIEEGPAKIKEAVKKARKLANDKLPDEARDIVLAELDKIEAYKGSRLNTDYPDRLGDLARVYADNTILEREDAVILAKAQDALRVVVTARIDGQNLLKKWNDVGKHNFATLKSLTKTYFVDEFQSDWNTAGRDPGFEILDPAERERLQDQQASEEAAEMKAIEARDKNREEISKKFVTNFRQGKYDKYIKEEPLQNIEGPDTVRYKLELDKNAPEELFLSINRGNNYHTKEDLYADQAHNMAKNTAENKAFRAEVDKLGAQNMKTSARLRSDVPNMPFSGDAWLRLGLKRALIDAAEGGYDSFAWPTSGVLVDRWAEKFDYKPQYDEKMPSIVKKLTGQKPFEFDIGEDHKIWIISLTPELKAKIKEESFALFQKDGGSKRGSFSPDTSTITLLKDADLSTFVHEFGHFALETNHKVAMSENAPMAVRKDHDAMLRWFGIEGKNMNERMANWDAMDLEAQREFHEQFARGFEAYLFEGKAPSMELKGVFSRIRSWLVNVYRDLKNLNVQLTDEVREVFDRMLATEEQIKEAEATANFEPLFKSASDGNMTDDQYLEYHNLAKDATQEAVATLEARNLRDMKWLSNAQSKLLKKMQKEADAKRKAMRSEVSDEVLNEPVNLARTYFKRGTYQGEKVAADPVEDIQSLSDNDIGNISAVAIDAPIPEKEGVGILLSISDEEQALLASVGIHSKDGQGKVYTYADVDTILEERKRRQKGGTQTPKSKGVHKLDAELVEDMLPMSQFEMLADKSGKFGMLTKKGGMHPDMAAEMFGYTSGDQLLKDLVKAENPKDKIERLTDQRMLERYGDLADDTAIERAVEEALHNKVRTKFISAELAALNRASGKRSVLTSAAKAYADDMISRLKIRDLKPYQYRSAEVRAAKNAEKALGQGNTALAATEKRNQLINNYATRATLEGQETVEKGVRYLNKFSNKNSRNSLDVEYLDQIDTLLERFDLRKARSLKQIDRSKSLESWLESQKEQGLEPQLDEKMLNEAFRKHYKDMTLEEFKGLVDAIKQIEHMGRLKHKLLTAKDKRRFEEIKLDILTSITKNATGKPKDLRTRSNAGGDLKRMGVQFTALHRKMASLAQEMDGFKDGGAVWEYLIRSMNAAGDKEASMTEDATKRLNELATPLLKGDVLNGRDQYFPSIDMGLKREERLAIALNVGNASNLQRLLDGQRWTPEQIQPVLDSLSQEDWDFVQGVWDFFESYRPIIADKEKRIYGTEPQWLDATPVNTRFGTLRGGYYPVKYDPAQHGVSAAHAEAEEARDMMRGAYTAATTRRSFTKERAEKVMDRPLMYSLQGLYNGVAEVVHDLAWHEWIIDANRILRDKDIDKAIRTNYGADAATVFKDTIKDIAQGDAPARNAWEKALNHVRVGATVVGLGWNFTTSFLQPLGLTNSMARIGPGWVARGMVEWIKHPGDKVVEIHDKSEFMRLRAKTMQREINEIQNKLQGNGLVAQVGAKAVGAEAASNFKGWTELSFFLTIQKMQMVADVPTWLGQYEKSVAEGESDERAVALADQAVIDAQGGGQIKDLAAIQRGGPTQKLWTNFYSYFSVVYNLNVDITKRTNFKNPAQVAVAARDYLLVNIVPAVMSELLYGFMKGEMGDDEFWEDLPEEMVAGTLSYLMGTMVGVREMTAVVQKMFGLKSFGTGYQGPAGLRALQESFKLGTQISQGEVDDAFRKSALNTTGILFHLPTGQLNKTWDGIQAVEEGEAGPMAILGGKPYHK